MSHNKVSIVIRSLNEEKWLGAALEACHEQRCDALDVEIVLVDSGSTDRTVEIAEGYGCRVVHIRKSEFTFGRSLNVGCDAATSDYLVFISAHCIPANNKWLTNLVTPLVNDHADYVYGRQLGHEVTRFSEHQIFAQYFPERDKLPQEDCFINNANAAIRRDVWKKYRFDESVTGLEDMALGKALQKDGGRIGYVADAPVFHIHEETYSQIRRRYYREALTLREIMPEIHFNFGDFIRYFAAGVFHDFSEALEARLFLKNAPDIIGFRLMQYWGVYRGHNEHRILSRAQKESYYYPRVKKKKERRQVDAAQSSPDLQRSTE